jgi:hypothetical protein
MQIMEQILLYDSKLDQKDKEVTSLRKTWVSRFLRVGGLDQIIQMMKKILHELQQNTKVDLQTAIEMRRKKELLTLTLKLVMIFVQATITAVKEDVRGE